MSGTGSTIIVASALHTSVLCTSTPEPGLEPAYSVTLVGNRDPNAINGVGFTYGVDAAAFDEWIALNADLAVAVRPATQEEIDAHADSANMYGYELGLQAEGAPEAESNLTPLEKMTTLAAAADPRASLELAGQQRRNAELRLRQAEAAKNTADLQAEQATADRDQAEAAQQAAMALIAEQDAAKPAPPPPAPPPPAQPTVAGATA